MNHEAGKPAGKPALSLEDLASEWLCRRITDLKAMPGLNNTIGSVQAESDVLAIKHPVFPPYSGSGEITGFTFIGKKHLSQMTDWVKLRWKAYEIERECTAGSWFLSSRTVLHPSEPAVAVYLTVTNPTARAEQLDIGFLLSGRSRNTGTRGYAWAVPEVPTSVSSFNSTEGLYQRVSQAEIPGTLEFVNDRGNGYSLQSFSPEPDSWEGGQTARFSRLVGPGDSLTVRFLAIFHPKRDAAFRLLEQWKGREKALQTRARLWWERLWEAAFQPGNEVFSGHLPILYSSSVELLPLYYMAVLTALTCRRTYRLPQHPQTDPAGDVGDSAQRRADGAPEAVYLTLWPRRGEGSAYLPWELPYISGLLSKLDPAALERMWKLTAEAPFLDSQVVNYLEGSWGGWTCAAHPQGIVKGALELERWAGRKSRWKELVLNRKPRQAAGFEAASQNQAAAVEVPQGSTLPQGSKKAMTGWDTFLEAVTYHRMRSLPDGVIDIGSRGSYLECVTDYAHGTAALTAAQVWALNEAAPLLEAAAAPGDADAADRREAAAPGGASSSEAGMTAQEAVAEADRLAAAVKALYCPGKGYFACRFPDGRRYEAPNLYDMGMVLACMGAYLDPQDLSEIATFAREHLITPTWCRNLWPLSTDCVSGLRCDHQWAGSFPAWPAQFLLGLTRLGCDEPWVEQWLQGMARIPGQGPFGQAYWAEDIYPTEAGAAAKCFDELTQGNHWVILSGVHFFDLILEGLIGVRVDLKGRVTLEGGVKHYQQTSSLRNLSVQGRLVHLLKGEITEIEP